jgi:hypothetical protein
VDETPIKITIADTVVTAQLADNAYAPSGNLVCYCGDVGYWNGIVRIGRFDTTMELIEHRATAPTSPHLARETASALA